MKIYIDEAGRGPLAGPVHVGLVMHGEYGKMKHYQDSKTLTEDQREELYNHMLSMSNFHWAVTSSSAAEIDRWGIVRGIRTAIMRGLHQLYEKEKNADYSCARLQVLLRELEDPCELVIDGPSDFGLSKLLKVQCTTIVKGDQKNKYISMASILAKVTRDREMVALHDLYPDYGFAKHKGYGTLEHRNAIMVHGLSDIHRRSFCRNIIML